MKKLFLCVALLALGACGRAEKQASTKPTSAPAPQISVTAPVKLTSEQWRAALLSTYTESSVEDKGDGVTDFFACFKKNASKCEVYGFGRRDAFQKVRLYKMGSRSAMSGSTLCPFIKSIILVSDEKKPIIVLKPCFYGKNGWLFMDKASVMADGEMALEVQFDRSKVERNVDSPGVEEITQIPASEADILALRKIASASVIMVRISGEKGYVSLKKNDLKEFKAEVDANLIAFDAMTQALEKAGTGN